MILFTLPLEIATLEDGTETTIVLSMICQNLYLDLRVGIYKLLLNIYLKTFTRAIAKAFYSVIGSKSLTDSEIKWGYHMAKFTYKSNAVANYVHNMRQLNAVASLYNGYFLSVVQPWITQDANNSSQSTSDLLRYASVNRGFLHTRDQFYLDLESELDPSFMVKSPEFEANDFVDHCHLADCGLKLAKFVFSQLFPNEHKIASTILELFLMKFIISPSNNYLSDLWFALAYLPL